MAWLAVDKDEHIFKRRPEIMDDGHKKFWSDMDIISGWDYSNIRESTAINLPEGTIEKLIGRKLTIDDDPVEFS